MKLVDDKLQERLLDYLSSQEDQEARQLFLLLQRKRTKKAPYHHGDKKEFTFN